MRKSYRYLAAWLMAGLFSLAASSQVTITGTVRNSTNKEGVAAVSVIVKGTGKGDITNSSGFFSIKVSKLPVVLVFSSAEYAEKEVNVSSASQPLVVDFMPNVIMTGEVVLSAA